MPFTFRNSYKNVPRQFTNFGKRALDRVWSIAIPTRNRFTKSALDRRNFSMSNAKKQYRIAVIPGDGIGKEVTPEGLRVIETAAKMHGVAVHFDHFDFASYDYYAKHGQMMPDDWKDKIGKTDWIYF